MSEHTIKSLTRVLLTIGVLLMVMTFVLGARPDTFSTALPQYRPASPRLADWPEQPSHVAKPPCA